MFKEASVYTLKQLTETERHAYGLRVLTMRRWPRGIRKSDIDVWVPSAGPSVALLLALRAEALPWEEFLARYLEEQERQECCQVISYESSGASQRTLHGRRSLDVLMQLAGERGIITLLCWEQGTQCHRFALAKRLAALAANSREEERS